MSCFAISVTSCKSRLPDTPSVMIGAASRSNLLTRGVSIPSGRIRLIDEILSRASCAPTSPFFSKMKRTTTVQLPSRVVERNSSIPEIVLSASSIGLVTELSISSALAPGNAAEIEITGKSTLGNRSTLSSKYETIPKTTGTNTRTQVNTGRRMHNSEMLIVDPFGSRMLELVVARR